jgi:hypothetical protein
LLPLRLPPSLLQFIENELDAIDGGQDEAIRRPNSTMFSYRLDRNELRVARRREGRYLLRTNLTEHDPAKL